MEPVTYQDFKVVSTSYMADLVDRLNEGVAPDNLLEMHEALHEMFHNRDSNWTQQQTTVAADLLWALELVIKKRSFNDMPTKGDTIH